jgi:chromosome segregation ATPase
MPEQGWLSGFGIWLAQSVGRAIITVAVASLAVWTVGDRLLTHALSGFQTALDITNKKIDGIGERIDGLGQRLDNKDGDVLERLYQAINDTTKLEASVANRFERISLELKTTKDDLENLAIQVGATMVEIGNLGAAIERSNERAREQLGKLLEQKERAP